MLSGAPPGIRPKAGSNWLKIADSRAAKTHVARQHELAAGGADPPRDLGDRHEATCAQMAEQKCDRRLPGQLRRLRAVLGDAVEVDVRDEVVGVRAGAGEHEHLHRVVGLCLLDEGDQITDQLGPQEIHGRGRCRLPRICTTRRSTASAAPGSAPSSPALTCSMADGCAARAAAWMPAPTCAPHTRYCPT